MSCSLALLDRYEWYIAVDTARSQITFEDGESEILRYKHENVKKIHEYGQDLCFVSGLEPYTSEVKESINNFVINNHVDVDKLSQYLLSEYPMSKSVVNGLAIQQIGVTIYQVIDGRTVYTPLNQDQDFRVKSKKCDDGILLYCDGIHNDIIGQCALDKLKQSPNDRLTPLIEAFQENYYEAVGGKIVIYHLSHNESKKVKEVALDETNLKYVKYENKNQFNSHLQGASGTFAGKVEAGQVVGSTITGSTITGNNIEGGNIKGSYIEGGTIRGTNVYGSNIEGTTITGGTINGTTITGATLNTNNGAFTVDSNGTLHANTATFGTGSTTMSIDSSGFKTFQNGVQKTNLYINGLTTDIIAAKSIGVYDSYGHVQNVLTSGDASSFAPSSHYHGTLYSNSSSSGRTAYISSNTNFVCPDNGDLGTSSNPWISVRANNVYNSGGLITSSDERKKNTIEPLNDKYNLLFDKLNPVSYKYNDGTSGRTHLGLIAQEVEQSINDVGLTDKECAILVKDPVYDKMNEDGSYDETSEVVDYDYSIRYNELIPMLINEIKELKNETKELKQKLIS